MRYTILLLALLIYLIPLMVSAQHWQPFSPNRTYHFTQSGAVDSLFNFRVTPGPLMAGDSAWEFQPMALVTERHTGSVSQFKIRADNQFGHWIVRRTAGLYEFTTDSAGSFQLLTQAAVGQSWAFGAGVQATLLSRGVQNGPAGQSDSVQIIALSAGGFATDTLVLSKEFGLLQTPAFMAFADTLYSSRQLVFHSLPELGIGINPITFRNVFDFQPGDRFQRRWETHPGTMQQNMEGWIQDIILSRTDYGTDSIQYSVSRTTLEHCWLSVTPCSVQYTPSSTLVVTYRAADLEQVNMMSQGFYLPSFAGNYATFPYYRSGYHGSFRMDAEDVEPNGQGNLMPSSTGVTFGESYAQGLGQVYYWYLYPSINFGPSFTELDAYVKGSETYGTWLNLSLLATTEEQPVSPVSLFPNPAHHQFTLQMPENITTGSRVLLTDVLSRVIWQGAAQPEQVVSLADQPPGVYLLTVQQGDRTWHTKVMKE